MAVNQSHMLYCIFETSKTSQQSQAHHSLLAGASTYRDLVRFMASRASFSIRSRSTAQVGMSWIKPIT